MMMVVLLNADLEAHGGLSGIGSVNVRGTRALVNDSERSVRRDVRSGMDAAVDGEAHAGGAKSAGKSAELSLHRRRRSVARC